MRVFLVSLLTIVSTAIPADAASERLLSDTLPAQEIDGVLIEVGVGDIDISGSQATTVDVQVALTPRRGGIFSSLKDAEEDVEGAVLSAKISDRRLVLSVRSPSGERRFEEQWSLRLPERLPVQLEVGVGELAARGIRGGIVLEAGVGDVTLEEISGNISIEVGVGDVAISGHADGFGSVNVKGGVGDARLEVRGERISSDRFVGSAASWTGSGPDRIVVKVGVGEAQVTLR